MIRRALFIVALSLCLDAGAVCAETPATFQPVKTEAGYSAEITGIWRSEGYGYILAITPSRLSLYHEAGGLCLRDGRPEEDPDEQFGLWYDMASRTDALPPACAHQTPLTPEMRFQFATATLTAWYPSFERRNVDWPALIAGVRKVYPHFDTDAQVWDGLSRIFAALDDPHSKLNGTVDGKPMELDPGEARTLKAVGALTLDGKTGPAAVKVWLNAWRTGILTDLLKGKGHQAGNSRLFWGRVGDIGYLNVLTMGGFDEKAAPWDTEALNATLDEAMQAFAGAKAVVVDVSNNRGGYDAIARVIAQRFASEKTLSYTKQPAGSPQTAPQPFYLSPSDRPRYLGPVYLVTSDITVSSGETFTAYMKALPQVVQVGTATRGALSDRIEKPLGDGWRFTLSAEIYKTADGYWAEGTGFAPDIAVDVYGPDFARHAQSLQALFDRIDRVDPAPVLAK
ncbi:hypothetical protein AEAC466_02995 [Asticcacaulis sp. AC466]|uniref:S41 family peptidase n=1 Tax=Asticcacaulis sp. AC466 TaxID=1282362 RepID=UPI0003C3BA71|nr:S41 family peptidase [Asticcacaulis sp. AC466]ESQ86176.1 hypothetical protein AEAC466_02995 [Asticcacaulis sp. AC466]